MLDFWDIAKHLKPYGIRGKKLCAWTVERHLELLSTGLSNFVSTTVNRRASVLLNLF